MRALGLAYLALGLTCCTQLDPIESPFPDDGSDEDFEEVPDAGRDGGRDAGRDAGRPRVDSSVPFVDGFEFDGGFGFFDGGFAVAPSRLSLLMKSQRPPPPISGGTLAVRDDGSYAVAADPDRDRIYVVPLQSGAPPTTIELTIGSEPGRVVLDAKGRAHVALRGAGQVLTLDVASGQELARSPLCALPRGLAYDATEDALVVACAGGELVTALAGTHAPLGLATPALDLRDVVVQADGTRLVSRYRSAELLRVSAQGELLSRSEPFPVTQAAEGVFGDPLFGKDVPDAGLVSPSASPTLAWRTVASGSGEVLMLHQQSRDSEIDLGQGTGSASYGGGCATITAGAVTRFGAHGEVGFSFGLAPLGLVVDVAASPDGRMIALAAPGAYLQALPTVELIGTGNGNPNANVIESDAGGPPSCVAGLRAGAEFQATAVAFDGAGKLYVFSREPAGLHVYPAAGPQGEHNGIAERDILLSLESVRDTGHELFHADVGSGLSCAGCHGEALDDAHVWNFKGFGGRRTQTMRGGLLSTLPLHWEGDLLTFQSLVDEVMTRRMGGFAVEARYGQALAEWLDQLPPLTLGVTPDDAARRGQTVFESAEVGCATCHSGAHFTNNQSADVGTGGLYQVPTLLGVALHPPFMHDGCAATLEQRFAPSCGGGDAHGHTSQLTQAQLADLIAYLKTL